MVSVSFCGSVTWLKALRWASKNKTDRPPRDTLHDEVLTGLQVFDGVFAQRGVGLDEALDDFVEVEGGELDHIQYPGEADVGFHCVPAEVVAPSLKTALWYWQEYSCVTCKHDM